MSPEAVVQVLHGLELSPSPGGGAELVFQRELPGGRLFATYRPKAPPHDRLRLDAHIANAPTGLRVLAAAELPGYRDARPIGEPDFDAACCVLAQDATLLACLRQPVRDRLRHLIGLGGWLDGRDLGLPAVVITDLTPAEVLGAGQLLEALVESLYAVDPHEALTRCAQDPAEGVREGARVWVQRRIEAERLDVRNLVAALHEHRPPNPLRWLTGFAVPAAAIEDWVAAIDTFGGPQGSARADDALLGALRGAPAPAATAIRALLSRQVMARLAAGDATGVEAVFAVASRDDALLHVLAERAVHADVRAAARWFRGLSYGRLGQLQTACTVFGAIGDAQDVPWLVTQLTEDTSRVLLSVAAERAVLDLLPDALAAGGAAHEALATLIRPGGQLGVAILEAVARMRPPPLGTAALLVAHWRAWPDAHYAQALMATRDPAATPGLVACLKIESAPNRSTICEALGEFGDAGALPTLRDLTGFFVEGDLRAAARAAVAAIEARGGGRGGLSLSSVAGSGGLSEAD